MKKILSLIACVLAFGLVAKADTQSTTLSGATNQTILLLGPAKILNITLSSTSQTNGLINFYDSPYITNNYIVAAFTNLTRANATTNIVYTNIFGALNTNSYTVIRYTTNTVAAAARLRPLVASFVTVSNTLETRDYDGLYIGQGLLITNAHSIGGAAGAITINIEYEKLR